MKKRQLERPTSLPPRLLPASRWKMHLPKTAAPICQCGQLTCSLCHEVAATKLAAEAP